MRLDRCATVHLYHPVSRLLSRDREARVPILMYHRIGENAADKRGYYGIYISPKVFARQMQFLRETGYETLNLDEAIQLFAGSNTPGKYAIITFDDGFRDFYTEAYPILREYRFKATVFVVTGFVEKQKTPSKSSRFMTWSELRELRSNGFQIGSHTVTHPQLNFLNPAQVDHEVGHSKMFIEDKLGAPVKSFAFPYAFPEPNKLFIGALRESLLKHGYENGVSTIIGRARKHSNRFFLPRLPVNSDDDPRFFQAKLEGGYDWLHGPQYLGKEIKRFLRMHRNYRKDLDPF